MRELVLNDASIAAADQRTAMDWLVDIAKGMSLLVVKQVVQNTLRTLVVRTTSRTGDILSK